LRRISQSIEKTPARPNNSTISAPRKNGNAASATKPSNVFNASGLAVT